MWAALRSLGKAMRISVSSWRTTDRDVKSSLDAILRIADEESRRNSANQGVQADHHGGRGLL